MVTLSRRFRQNRRLSSFKNAAYLKKNKLPVGIKLFPALLPYYKTQSCHKQWRIRIASQSSAGNQCGKIRIIYFTSNYDICRFTSLIKNQFTLNCSKVQTFIWNNINLTLSIHPHNRGMNLKCQYNSGRNVFFFFFCRFLLFVNINIRE